MHSLNTMHIMIMSTWNNMELTYEHSHTNNCKLLSSMMLLYLYFLYSSNIHHDIIVSECLPSFDELKVEWHIIHFSFEQTKWARNLLIIHSWSYSLHQNIITRCYTKYTFVRYAILSFLAKILKQKWTRHLNHCQLQSFYKRQLHFMTPVWTVPYSLNPCMPREINKNYNYPVGQ